MGFIGGIGFLIGVIVLPGCAIGPDYRRPEVELPERWSQGGVVWKEAIPQDMVERGAWWEVFGDPQINRLVEQALEANQDLRAALARVQEARAVARVDAAELLPELDFNPSSDRFRRTRSSFGGAGGFTRSQFRVPWDLSYEVDLWGRVRRTMEASGAQAQAQAAAYEAARLTLAAEVAKNYFSLRELDAEIVVLEQTVWLRRQAKALVKRRYQGGLVSELDLTRAGTELAQAEAVLIEARRRRKEFEHALAVLCGKPATGFEVEMRPLDLQPPPIPAGIPSDLLERRPDVAQAERVMQAANARIGVAQAAFFPVIRLTGSIGWENARLGDLVTAESKIWSLGQELSLPIFNAGRNVAGVRAARARYEQEVAHYRQRVLEAMREVEDALANLRLRRLQAQVQEEAAAAARKSAELSRARYEQGLVNYLEVVDADRSRLEAELDLIRTLSQRLISTALLVKAIGGDWRPPEGGGEWAVVEREQAIAAALEKARVQTQP